MTLNCRDIEVAEGASLLPGKPMTLQCLREQTFIKFDLQSRMLQATFKLAKSSFEHAIMREKWSWCYKQFHSPYLFKQNMPDLHDFKRAYNLIHDWYPKLHEEVRVHRESWEQCTTQVLKSMKSLLQNKSISAEGDDTFEAWADKMLHKHEKDKQRSKSVNAFMKTLLAEDFIITGSKEDMTKEFHQMLDDIRAASNTAGNATGPEQTGPEQLADACCCAEDSAEYEKVRQNLRAMHALLSGPEASTHNSDNPWLSWLLEAKMTMLRVGSIILTLDFLFIYEASALGMLTQVFFQLNAEIDEGKKDLRLVKLFFLPVFILLYSSIGTVLADLAIGALHYPAFAMARARSIILLTAWQERSILRGELVLFPLRLIDFCFTWLLLLFAGVGGVMFLVFRPLQGEDSRFDCFLSGLNSGAFTWTLCCAFMEVVSRFYCNVWLERDCKIEAIKDAVFRPIRCSNLLREAFQTYGLRPGETWTYFLSLQRFLDIHKHDDMEWNNKHVPDWVKKEDKERDEENNTDGWEAYSGKLANIDGILKLSSEDQGSWWLCGSFILWILTGGVCWLLEYVLHSSHRNMFVLFTVNAGITLTVICLNFAAEKLMPVLTASKSFKIHGIGFLVLIYAFSYFTVLIDLPAEGTTALMTTSNMNGTIIGASGTFYNDGSNGDLVTPYPVCSMSWGSPEAKVHLIDLAAMSLYAYVKNKKDLDQLLNESFGNHATRVHFDDFDKVPRIVASRMCKSGDSKEKCTIIMAVKGTSNKLEVMTDVGIFSTVSVMQILDKVAPLFGTVPKTVVDYIISQFRLPFVQKSEDTFLEKLEDVMTDLKKKHSGDNLVLTGHSLGGNLAEVGGAKLGIPAVGFSAPGQFYMMKSFNIEREQVEQNVISIVPSMDPIPHVAKHVDVEQRILCRRRDGRYRSFYKCHSMQATACELWRVCGDVQRRDFTKGCLEAENNTEAFVNESCIGQPFSMKKDAKCRMKPETLWR